MIMKAYGEPMSSSRAGEVEIISLTSLFKPDLNRPGGEIYVILKA